MLFTYLIGVVVIHVCPEKAPVTALVPGDEKDLNVRPRVVVGASPVKSRPFVCGRLPEGPLAPQSVLHKIEGVGEIEKQRRTKKFSWA